MRGCVGFGGFLRGARVECGLVAGDLGSFGEREANDAPLSGESLGDGCVRYGCAEAGKIGWIGRARFRDFVRQAMQRRGVEEALPREPVQTQLTPMAERQPALANPKAVTAGAENMNLGRDVG